jgi:hypothetical protein
MSTNENAPSENEVPVKKLTLVRTTLVTLRARSGLRTGKASKSLTPGCMPSDTNAHSSGQDNG